MKRSGMVWQINAGKETSLVSRVMDVKEELISALKAVGITKSGLFQRDQALFFYFCTDDDHEGGKTDRQIFNLIDLTIAGHLADLILMQGVPLEEVFYTDGYSEKMEACQRAATFMQVKPGYEAAYRDAHDNIWPSILDGIIRTRIRSYSIFMNGVELYSYFEVEDLEKAMAELADDPDNQRWQIAMAPMMDVGSGMKDGTSVYFQEILFFE